MEGMEGGWGLTGQCVQCAACSPAMMWQCSYPHVRPLHLLPFSPTSIPWLHFLSPAPPHLLSVTTPYVFNVYHKTLAGFQSQSDKMHLREFFSAAQILPWLWWSWHITHKGVFQVSMSHRWLSCYWREFAGFTGNLFGALLVLKQTSH